MGCTRARRVSAPGRLIHRSPIALIRMTARSGGLTQVIVDTVNTSG